MRRQSKRLAYLGIGGIDHCDLNRAHRRGALAYIEHNELGLFKKSPSLTDPVT